MKLVHSVLMGRLWFPELDVNFQLSMLINILKIVSSTCFKRSWSSSVSLSYSDVLGIIITVPKWWAQFTFLHIQIDDVNSNLIMDGSLYIQR